MLFQFYQPSRSLQPFIEGYLEADVRHNEKRASHILFPNGFSGIFFNFGNKGKLIVKEAYDTPAVSIFGQIDCHFTVEHWPGFYSLGVLLKPAVLSQLLRINMAELTNKAFHGELFRNDFKFLHEQLEGTASVKEKIRLIECFFVQLLKNINYQKNITDHALNIIHQEGTISIEKLANQLNVSQRYLEMNFKKAIGLSPKTYSMIQRFKRIESHIKKSQTVNLASVDFADTYYDQNHFIKDFKRFTGHTPTDYLRLDFEMGRSYMIGS